MQTLGFNIICSMYRKPSYLRSVQHIMTTCVSKSDAGNVIGKMKFEEREFRVITPLPVIAPTTVTKSDILDFGEEGFLLHNLLTESECKHFITEGEKAGFEVLPIVKERHRSSKRQLGRPTNRTWIEDVYTTDTTLYISVHRIIFDSPALAGILWKRIKPWVPVISINGDPHEKHIHGAPHLMQGTWQPLGLNSIFRICRYMPGGHFCPHFDGHFAYSSQERSLQTFMLYLNSNFEGGNTNFVHESQRPFRKEDGKYCAEEKNILCSIRPEPGLAIIFNHRRLHEGQQVKTGVKYILRSDIMFRNEGQTTRTLA